MKILQNRNKSLRNRTVLFTTLGMALAFSTGLAVHTLMQPLGGVQYEQVGSSPESEVDSRIKEAIDSLVSQGHGGRAVAESTNDWGTMWNRIMAAASWTPGGDATTNDV